jgi:hypothetical protein
LIVYDEPPVRMLITEVVEGFAYVAIKAADATSGLKVLQSNVRIKGRSGVALTVSTMAHATSHGFVRDRIARSSTKTSACRVGHLSLRIPRRAWLMRGHWSRREFNDNWAGDGEIERVLRAAQARRPTLAASTRYASGLRKYLITRYRS